MAFEWGSVAHACRAAPGIDVLMVDWVTGATVALALELQPSSSPSILRQVGSLLRSLGQAPPLEDLASAEALIGLWQQWTQEDGRTSVALPGIDRATRRAVEHLRVAVRDRKRVVSHGDPSPANLIVTTLPGGPVVAIDALPAHAPLELILSARPRSWRRPPTPRRQPPSWRRGPLPESASSCSFLSALAVLAVDFHRTPALTRLAAPFFS